MLLQLVLDISRDERRALAGDLISDDGVDLLLNAILNCTGNISELQTQPAQRCESRRTTRREMLDRIMLENLPKELRAKECAKSSGSGQRTAGAQRPGGRGLPSISQTWLVASLPRHPCGNIYYKRDRSLMKQTAHIARARGPRTC